MAPVLANNAMNEREAMYRQNLGTRVGGDYVVRLRDDSTYHHCYLRKYQHGAITCSEYGLFRAYAIWGSIYSQWDGMKTRDENGRDYHTLGAARSDECDCDNGQGHKGRWNEFEWGNIYWSPSIGVKVVRGAIRDHYHGNGPWGAGFPTMDEAACGDGIGKWQTFERGVAYWKPGNSAYILQEQGFRNAWDSAGRDQGRLGYPTSDEVSSGNTKYVNFEHGGIYAAKDVGYWIIETTRTWKIYSEYPRRVTVVRYADLHSQGPKLAGEAHLTLDRNGSWQFQGKSASWTFIQSLVTRKRDSQVPFLQASTTTTIASPFT